MLLIILLARPERCQLQITWESKQPLGFSLSRRFEAEATTGGMTGGVGGSGPGEATRDIQGRVGVEGALGIASHLIKQLSLRSKEPRKPNTEGRRCGTENKRLQTHGP